MRLLLALILLSAGNLHAQNAVEAPFAQASHGRIRASVSAHVGAPCQAAWDVFTDFDAMASFVPGIESSQAVERTARRALLRQTGSARFGIFSRRYASERELRLDPPHRIDSQSSARDELDTRSFTLFEPNAQGCQIRYELDAKTPAWAPSALSESFAREQALRMMRAMLDEITRRQPAGGAPTRPLPEDKPIP